MPRASPRVRALQERLAVSIPSESSPLSWLVHSVCDLLHADQTLAYTWQWTTDGMRLGHFHGSHLTRNMVRPIFDGVAASAGRRFGFYDAVSPEQGQRNRALTREKAVRLSRNSKAAIGPYMERLGLTGEELRVLVCDGSTFVCWLGGYRAGGWDSTSVRDLQALVPALRRRMSLERLLEDAQVLHRGLDLALEQLPGAAFLVDEHGKVVHANAAGRARLETGAPPPPRESGTWATVEGRGEPRLTLRLLRPPGSQEPPMLALFSAIHGLTKREREVLALLARGWANASIAGELGCAQKTIEQHVTSLLRKTGTEGRSALVAMLWKEAQ